MGLNVEKPYFYVLNATIKNLPILYYIPKNYISFILMDEEKKTQIWPKSHLMNNLFCLFYHSYFVSFTV